MWLSGLLEGEGSFLCGPPSRPHLPIVTVSMTDRDIIERVSTLLGVGVVTSSRGRDKGWKTTFIAHQCGLPAVLLMKEIRPFMGDRRKQQIDRALASYHVKKNGMLKLSVDQVLEIQRRADSGEPLRTIATDFKVDHSLVWRIKRRKIHKTIGLVA